MQVGDKAPEVLGINEKGEEIRLLPQRHDIRLHGTSLQPAR